MLDIMLTLFFSQELPVSFGGGCENPIGTIIELEDSGQTNGPLIIAFCPSQNFELE